MIPAVAYALYDGLGVLVALLCVVGLPWLRFRGYQKGAAERLGRLPPRALSFDVRPIWIHAASVGETRAAAPLVRRLRQEYPSVPLIVSNTTVTGRAVSRRHLRPEVSTLLPVDFLRIIDRAFRRVRPRALIVIETEIWPGLMRAAAAVGAPIAVVSGRLSERTARRYRLAAPLFRAAVRKVSVFGMQEISDAQRIVALGASPERVVVSGNLKAAGGPEETQESPTSVGDDRAILVAASTQPGEEELVLRACSILWREWPEALLILAPRRPERFDEVADMLQRRNIRFARRSAGEVSLPDVSVLLLDTLGELTRFFVGARAAFVGGTIAAIGGHNVLEPATHSVPVAFGRHTENVAAAAIALCESGGGRRVDTAEELAEHWGTLLRSPQQAAQSGLQARRVAEARADAVETSFALLAPLLGG
jgi:3-deoxy-D-manno-octulosonic-acid transferase